MTRRGRWLALGAVTLAACGHALPVAAPSHGSVVSDAEGEVERVDRRAALAPGLVVLVEQARVRAIDPVTARSHWVLPLEVTGHPVANATTVYFPVRGHRLVAVDRLRGTVRFSVDLPGEALTGLDVSEQWIVASVVGGRKGARAELVAMASHDGHVRWRHRVGQTLGIPAVRGGVALVPVGAQVASFRIATGRELARQDVPGGAVLERVVHHGDKWLVGGGAQWVELGQGGRAHAIAGAHAPVFPTVDGIDPGHDDGERLRLWLGLSEHAIARDAMLLSRRAVVAMRLDADGRPSRARWVHVEARGEFVAMEVLGDDVVLVREDGAIVVLRAATGQVVDRIAGGDPVRGALVLGGGASTAARRPQTPDPIADLHALLLDPDPRLLPAQELAAELLWRDDNADVRAAVLALSSGAVRAEQTDAAEALRDHAAELTAGRWGQGSAGDVQAVLVALRRRPGAGVDGDDLAGAIREAARSGTPEVVEELTALLLHPGTRPVELVEIVETLSRLRDPAAVEALATFVRRYHADQVVAYESTALRAAAELLLVYAGSEAPNAQVAVQVAAQAAAQRARTVLEAVAGDPLCEPALRAFIARGLHRLAEQSPDDRATSLLSTRL